MNIKNSLLVAAAAAVVYGTWLAAAPAVVEPRGTLENLQAAYNGERNAKAKYTAYAAKAAAEGYRGIDGMFRAAAFAENVHAGQFARAIAALGGVPGAVVKKHVVGSTMENLEDSMNGELYENRKLYPAFRAAAVREKNDLAIFSFTGAIAAEKSHADLYARALGAPGEWRGQRRFLVCNICGYTTLDQALKKCPASASPRKKFTEVR